MPRRNACASASARWSSGSRVSGDPRGDAREPFAHEGGVHELTVLGDHVGEVAVVDVDGGAFLFEPHPAMEHQLRQPLARFAAERRGRVEAAADLRRVDAEQPHAAERRHVDRVAVDDRADQHGSDAGDAAHEDV